MMSIGTPRARRVGSTETEPPAAILTKPHLFLAPMWTDLEWTIRPLLERWADVGTYDPPGEMGEDSDVKLTRP